MEKIKFNQIESVITELFRKNNSNFITSRLSEVMLKIFTSLNGEFDKDARYMKSSIIPHRVYYIYSEKVSEDRLYDFVIINDEPSIWVYSNNMINAIGYNPIKVLDDLITNLIKLFKPECVSFDSLNEHTIVKISMIIRILKFLKVNYGLNLLADDNLISIKQLILDFTDTKEELGNKLHYIIDETTTNEKGIITHKVSKFIDEYIDAIYENYKYDNFTYYSSREYLDEYKMFLDYVPKDEDYE